MKTVMVKMATNGKEIGVWANWGDQTLNNTTIGPQDFRDQVAVQFPVQTSGAPPFQCMGQSGGTVNIWRWERGMATGHGRGRRGGCGTWTNNIPRSPGTFTMKSRRGGVTYPDRIGRSLGAVQSGDLVGEHHVGSGFCGASSVEDLNANGFSTLTTQASQDVMGEWPVGTVRAPLKGRLLQRADVARGDEAGVIDE